MAGKVLEPLESNRASSFSSAVGPAGTRLAGFMCHDPGMGSGRLVLHSGFPFRICASLEKFAKFPETPLPCLKWQ